MNTDKDLETAEKATEKAIENSKNSTGEQDVFYERMINHLNTYLVTTISEEDNKLETLNKTLDKKEYYTAFYRKELLVELKNKFFNSSG